MEDSPATRPGRRPRPRRRPERQQILLRRGLALGGGLLILILLVLGVKGCLDARKNRALSDYARDVTQIVEETDQTSKSLFDKLDDPGSLSVTDFIGEVNADRSAMDSYAARVDGLDAPGDMSHAQSTLELVYELRSSAMNEIADRMSTALGDVGSEQATTAIARQMRVLAASDVLYASVVRPEVNARARRQRDQRRRRGEKRLRPRRNQVAGRGRSQSARLARSAARPVPKRPACTVWACSGPASTAPNSRPKPTSSVISEGAPEVEVEVQNQGESTENGVTVSVTVNGEHPAGEHRQHRRG